MSNATYYVTKKQTCPACMGTVTTRVYCRQCLEETDYGPLEPLPDHLPCGHSRGYASEISHCRKCGGTGVFESLVSLEQALAALGLVAEPMAK